MTIEDGWNPIAIDVSTMICNVDKQSKDLVHAQMIGEGLLTSSHSETLMFLHSS